jgi:hypothetical protein
MITLLIEDSLLHVYPVPFCFGLIRIEFDCSIHVSACDLASQISFCRGLRD